MLKSRMPRPASLYREGYWSASRISSRVLPTPEKTIRSPGTPAVRSRSSSPPDTMSKPLPSPASKIGRASCREKVYNSAEDGIRDHCVTGVQTCALPIYVEEQDAATCVSVPRRILERFSDLLARLAHAGENDSISGHAGCSESLQLPAGHDVEAAAKSGKQDRKSVV